MKRVIIFLVAFIFLIPACHLRRETAHEWLLTKRGVAKVNLEGEWETGAVMLGGWGDADLYQEGNRVSGKLGFTYQVEGIVNGNTIWLSIYEGDNVYYTAMLKPLRDGRFGGEAVAGQLYSDSEFNHGEIYPIIMRRKSSESILRELRREREQPYKTESGLKQPRDARSATIMDISPAVRAEVLKEMTVDDLKNVVDGMDKTTASKITADAIRTIHNYNMQRNRR